VLRLPLLVVAACAISLPACQRGPAVPALASFGQLDPAVSSLLAEHLTAIEASPEDANRWGVLAMSLEANGLTGPAREAYTTATGLPANHGRWWYHRGRLRARDGDVAAALDDFDRAIAASPDYVPARWRRGQVLLDRGDLGPAEAAFRVAVNLAPDSAGVTGLARTLMARGQAAEAVPLLEALLDRAPDDRYVYQVLATAYRAQGRADDAAEALAAGAAGQPRFIDPWLDEMGGYRRGFAATLKEATALGMEGRFAEAIRLLEGLRAARPDDRELRTYLAGLYATAGRTAEAKPLLDAILAAHPDDFDATMNLATAHFFDGAWDAADGVVTKALGLRPGDGDATRLRGAIAWRRGRLDDAERWLAMAAAANPADAKALAWIGSIRTTRGDHRRALEAYRSALARDPLLGDALVGGAAAALSAGAVDDAARWVARARKVAPRQVGLPDVERRLSALRTPRS